MINNIAQSYHEHIVNCLANYKTLNANIEDKSTVALKLGEKVIDVPLEDILIAVSYAVTDGEFQLDQIDSEIGSMQDEISHLRCVIGCNKEDY